MQIDLHMSNGMSVYPIKMSNIQFENEAYHAYRFQTWYTDCNKKMVPINRQVYRSSSKTFSTFLPRRGTLVIKKYILNSDVPLSVNAWLHMLEWIFIIVWLGIQD